MKSMMSLTKMIITTWQRTVEGSDREAEGGKLVHRPLDSVVRKLRLTARI
jgi:hypothetical protein